MSAINVGSGSIVPAVLATGATAGTAGGATTLAVQTLPATGAGMTLLLVIFAITFILVGAVLLWNPLSRRPGKLVTNTISSAPGPQASLHRGLSD